MRVFWVETGGLKRLAIATRPRGGDWLLDDMRALRSEGVDLLVSLLTPDEEDELGLGRERSACQEAGIQYFNFPIPDRDVPDSESTLRYLVTQLEHALEEGKSIAAHCRAGIGRSSLLIAALLTTRPGTSVEEAFARITAARGLQVPDTPQQVQWLEKFARIP